MIDVLADDDAREQRRTGAPLLDHLVRGRRDRDPVLALRARELLAPVHLDEELGRLELQDLARLVPDAHAIGAADRARALGRRVHDVDATQRVRGAAYGRALLRFFFGSL